MLLGLSTKVQIVY